MKRTFVSITLLFFLSCSILSAQKENLLSSKYSAAELRQMIIPQAAWTPFPRLADREGWAKADKNMLQACIKSAESSIGYDWPTIPATLSLLYVRTGNRSQYGSVSSKKRNVLATMIIAEVAENKGRFIDPIINGIWSICEESWWGASAHLPRDKEYAGLMDVSKPFVDLFAAETGKVLAWADYFLGDRLDAVSPQIRKRIYNEITYRLLDPFMKQDHWWTGKNGSIPNNWNPWICSNLLNIALLIEKDEQKRVGIVAEILAVLDNFFNPYPQDGGCDEGPNYWNAAGAALYDNIVLLNLASKGAFRYVYENEKFRNMGRYIYKAQISESYALNFADASPQIGVVPDMVYCFGKDIGDRDMMDFGAFYYKPNVAASAGIRSLRALFMQDELQNAAKRLPLPQDVWLPDLQVAAARDRQGTTEGFYLAAKGGHNNESHNHNDIGNYVVFYDGQPLLIDVGSGSYTARTFSSKRYDIWFNRSDFHNLPTVNGKAQQSGRRFVAAGVSYRAGKSSVVFSLDIAKAYPKEAAINSWKRTVTLNRGKSVTIKDVADLQKADTLTQHIMTCYPSEVTQPGKLVIHYQSKDGNSTDFVITYNPRQMKAEVEKVTLSTEEDKGVQSKWGDRIYRINFNVIAPKLKDTYMFEIKKKQ
ncbi:MAG: heparinase II/III-family protein [Prevotellaceae bacterium]|nr:heparinase II/III-family protein [Prevotellaceae bacterium]